MGKLLSAFAAATLTTGLVALPAAAQAADAPRGNCIGVSVKGNGADIVPNITIVPGDKGSNTLTVTNNAWSDAVLTAKFSNVKITGDPVFASDLRLGINGTFKPAAELAKTATDLVSVPIKAGASTDLTVAHEYPATVTSIPQGATSVSYSVAIKTTGDDENATQVSCLDKPKAAPTSNPFSVASVSKITDVNGDGKSGAGDTISYDLTVTNGADTQVKEVKVASRVVPGLGKGGTAIAKASATGPAPALAAASSTGTPLQVTCPTTVLGAKEPMTCTTSAYTITETDVAAGGITNITTASAHNIAGVEVTAPDTTDETKLAVAIADPTPSPTTPTPAPAPVPPAPVPPSVEPQPMAVTDTVTGDPNKGFAIIDAGAAALASMSPLVLFAGLAAISAGAAVLIKLRRRPGSPG